MLTGLKERGNKLELAFTFHGYFPCPLYESRYSGPIDGDSDEPYTALSTCRKVE